MRTTYPLRKSFFKVFLKNRKKSSVERTLTTPPFRTSLTLGYERSQLKGRGTWNDRISASRPFLQKTSGVIAFVYQIQLLTESYFISSCSCARSWHPVGWMLASTILLFSLRRCRQTRFEGPCLQCAFYHRQKPKSRVQRIPSPRWARALDRRATSSLDELASRPRTVGHSAKLGWLAVVQDNAHILRIRRAE